MSGVFQRVKKWLGGGGARGKQHAAVQYHGYAIIPCPRPRKNGGWGVEALIRKPGADGAAREHVFIRADACNSEEGAVALSVHKAKTLIDQKGDAIFSERAGRR